MHMKVLKLNFSKITSQFNPIYFTILEILVEMKIRIIRLELNCSLLELADFMTKHKKSGSLNIDDIEIVIGIEDINRESIDNNLNRIIQYSYLIEGKIKISVEKKFSIYESKDEKILRVIENNQKDLIEYLYYRNKANMNIIEFDFVWESDLYKHHKDRYAIYSHLSKYKYAISNSRKLYFYEKVFTSRSMKEVIIYLANNKLQKRIKLFIFYKEYQNMLVQLTKNDDKEKYIEKNLKSIVIETLFDTKYREKLVYLLLYLMIRNKFNKKIEKYLRLHMIRPENLNKV